MPMPVETACFTVGVFQDVTCMNAIHAHGPLAAEFGEAAGHIAGSVAGVLRDAGVDEARALVWQEHLQAGAVLLGAHVVEGDAEAVRRTLEGCGPRDSAMTEWE